ncbi:MAG: hypothetical protein GX444_03475 [Myxococcales bacterium]|nr:hypothetical protein [Myxococcales bacterium]
MRLRLVAVLLFLTITPLFLGCSEKFDTREDPTLEEILRIGKRYLVAGDGGNASDAFEAAIKLSPTCDEAKFGLLISRNMQFMNLLNQLVAFASGGLAQTMPADPGAGLDMQVLAESSNLGDYIQEFLGESAEVWYQACEQLYLDLMNDPDPSFEIEGFTMKLEGIVTFQFGGRLDRSDLQFFGVLNSLVEAVVNIAMAHDLNYDFFSLQIPSLNFDLGGLEDLDLEAIQDLLEQLDPLIDLVESLITYEDNPDFLTLKGEDGVKRMQAAGVQLGQLFYRLHLLIDTAYRETGPQEAGTVHFIDDNMDGQGDRQLESLFIPGFGALEPDLVNGIDSLCILTAPAFWDETAYDTDPTHANPFYISYANDLLTALDVLPIVIDKEMIEDLLGIDLNFLGDNFEIVISEIPEILPIDVGPWFAYPSMTGIKDLLQSLVDLWDLVYTLVEGL